MAAQLLQFRQLDTGHDNIEHDNTVNDNTVYDNIEHDWIGHDSNVDDAFSTWKWKIFLSFYS